MVPWYLWSTEGIKSFQVSWLSASFTSSLHTQIRLAERQMVLLRALGNE